MRSVGRKLESPRASAPKRLPFICVQFQPEVLRNAYLMAIRQVLCLCGRRVVHRETMECARCFGNAARWMQYIDECFVCDAKAPRGTMWCWGYEDMALCDGCAREWRNDVSSQDRNDVWGRW